MFIQCWGWNSQLCPRHISSEFHLLQSPAQVFWMNVFILFPTGHEETLRNKQTKTLPMFWYLKRWCNLSDPCTFFCSKSVCWKLGFSGLDQMNAFPWIPGSLEEAEEPVGGGTIRWQGMPPGHSAVYWGIPSSEWCKTQKGRISFPTFRMCQTR